MKEGQNGGKRRNRGRKGKGRKRRKEGNIRQVTRERKRERRKILHKVKFIYCINMQMYTNKSLKKKKYKKGKKKKKYI